MDFKTHIKQRLKKEGKTTAELVSYLGMTDSNYYSNMKKASWKLRQLDSIAEFFSCKVPDLFVDEASVDEFEIGESPLPVYPVNCKNCERLEKEVEFLRKQNDRLIAIVDKMQNDR